MDALIASETMFRLFPGAREMFSCYSDEITTTKSRPLDAYLDLEKIFLQRVSFGQETSL